jgi:hypothetical protein
MGCHDLKLIRSNWGKLILDRFYCMRISKLKNIVTKTVEIQVEGEWLASARTACNETVEGI